MTVPAFVVAARTKAYLTQRQEIIANNQANTSTDGFKADRITGQSFAEMLPEALASLDLRQGTVRDTGRPFDVALENDGFMIVRTGQGERLTRGGSLTIDAAGLLVDRDGNPVMGHEGPLLVRGERVEIESDGTVVVDGARAGRIRFEQVANPATLLKEGAGRFIATGGTIGAPDARLKQGALEDANVDPLVGTVDMLQIQRAYSTNAEVLRVLDSVLGTLTGDIGRI
jgi:flagellar basal body rod protein FlgG